MSADDDEVSYQSSRDDAQQTQRQIKCESSPPTPRASRIQQLQGATATSSASTNPADPVNR